MTDEQRAARIDAAVRELNAALDSATEAGIEVDLDMSSGPRPHRMIVIALRKTSGNRSIILRAP